MKAYYIEYLEDTIMTGEADVRNGIPRFVGEPVPLKDVKSERTSEREIAVIIDVNGLRRKSMDERVIRAKIPGSDIWYMTCIERGDDVFDGFLSNGEALMIPYHTILSDNVLAEAYDLSDSCIPTFFVSEGKAMSIKGSKNLMKVLETAENMGFPKTVVFDTDYSLNAEDWKNIREKYPGAVPFVYEDRIGLKSLGFGDVITNRL